MGENHKDEQKPERNGRNHEKIRRDEIVRVVVRKSVPILRRWLPVPDRVLADCCLRDLNAEFH